MSDSRVGTVRHMWRAGVIAGLIGVVGALAGCSSSGADANVDTLAGAAAPNGGVAAQDASKGSEAAAPAADTRSLIITGSLYITVKDPLVAADRAAGIVNNAGGRVDARNETAPQGRDGGSASLTLRIPADRLDGVVDDLRALGTVDHFATEARDVSTEVTDLDAKISTLRDSTDRIQALLLKAQNIADIITLENELASRQAELQSLEAQQRGLHDQVSMSTIDLSLTTEPVVIVDDSPANFWDGLVSGWNALVAFLGGLSVVVAVLLPWLGLMALIAVPVFLAVRARRSRAAALKAEALAGVPAVPAAPVSKPARSAARRS